MTDNVIRNLASRVLRAEVAARRPKDVAAVIDAISTRIRFDTDGGIYVVDRDGRRDPSKNFDKFLADVQRDRPELFQDAGEPQTDDNVNPFRRGPGYSLTNQMFLMKTNPELAAQYEQEAKT